MEPAQELYQRFKDMVSAHEEDLAPKAFFYQYDEPGNWSALQLDKVAERMERVWPGYHMVIPFYSEINEAISYLNGRGDIFCPNQATLKSNDTCTRLINNSDGWYRIWRFPGDGAEGSPYLFVWPLLSVGPLRRVLFWQQYLLKTHGILYYNVEDFVGKNPWENMTLARNGDGVLLFPGAPIGLDPREPVLSLRLKQISNGIDDFDYFQLAKHFLGDEFVWNEVSKVIWGIKGYNYTKIFNKEDGFNAWTCMDMVKARISIGEALHELHPRHSFGEWRTVAEPDDTHGGLDIRTCSVCGTQERRVTKKADESDQAWHQSAAAAATSVTATVHHNQAKARPCGMQQHLCFCYLSWLSGADNRKH